MIAGGLPDELPQSREGGFDLIALLDVLEHVEDDVAALSGITRILHPSGYVMITVPAYDFLWSAHDEAHHHYRRYTLSRLAKTIDAAGLKIVNLSYFNTLLSPAMVAVRWVSRLRKVGYGSDLSLPSAPVNALLAWLFALGRYPLSLVPLPFDVSLFALARIRAVNA